MRKTAAATVLLSLASSASAHHPLDGLPMETFAHGLLSGAGHPLLGFDHLFFIVAMGIAAALSPRRLLAPLAYIGTMLLACLLSAFAVVSASELLIALSVFGLGCALLSGRMFSVAVLGVAFAAAGLVHGAAFGATLTTQEAGYGLAVLLGYLAGLGVIQYLVAVASGALFCWIWRGSKATALQPRLAGAMVAGAGLLLIVEHLEGPLLAVIAS